MGKHSLKTIKDSFYTHDPGYLNTKCLIYFLRLSGESQYFSKNSLSQMAPENRLLSAKICDTFHDTAMPGALNSAI